MAQTDLRRALSISLGFPPTPEELAADPDLPRLQQKWQDSLEDIRSVFEHQVHTQLLNDAMTNAARAYWTTPELGNATAKVRWDIKIFLEAASKLVD